MSLDDPDKIMQDKLNEYYAEQEELLDNSLLDILKTKAGRLVLADLIWDKAKISQLTLTENDPIGMAYNDGVRYMGLVLEKKIKELDIDNYLVMVKGRHSDEAYARTLEATLKGKDKNDD